MKEIVAKIGELVKLPVLGPCEIDQQSVHDYFECPQASELKSQQDAILQIIELKQHGNSAFKGVRLTYTNKQQSINQQRPGNDHFGEFKPITNVDLSQYKITKVGLKVTTSEEQISYSGIRLYEEGGTCVVDKVCQEDYGRDQKWEYQ